MAEDRMSQQEALDETLIAGLAAGLTHEQAGGAAGVSAKTVQRRLHDPEFSRRLGEARAARHAQIGGALLSGAERAVATLVGLLDDDDPKVRLSAARELLGSSGRFVDQADILHRLAAVEQAVAS